MAITAVLSSGVTSLKSAGTTITVTNSPNGLAAGDVIVILTGFDNTGTSTPTVTASGGTGITWVTQVTGNSNSATSGNAVRTAIITGVCSQSVASGTTFTLTYSATITAKQVVMWAFRGVDNTNPVRSGTSNSAQGSSTTSSVTTGATNPVSGDVVVAVACSESNTLPGFDTDTTNGSWANDQPSTMSGGNSATNVNIRCAYKITTGSGAQTHDNTVDSSDWSASILALQPNPDREASAECATATASAQDPVRDLKTGAGFAATTSAGFTFTLSDNFNYGTTTLSGGSTEGTWVQGSTDPWETTGTQAYAPISGTDCISGLIWETPNGGLSLPLTKAKADWISGDMSVVTRQNGATGYGFGRYGANHWRLTKHVSGTVTEIGYGSGNDSPGYPIWVQAEGSLIWGDANYGGISVQVTDTSITASGYTGNALWSYTTEAYADNFVASVPEYSLTPTKQIQPTPTEAAATASALDATVDTSSTSDVNVDAGCATATATDAVLNDNTGYESALDTNVTLGYNSATVSRGTTSPFAGTYYATTTTDSAVNPQGIIQFARDSAVVEDGGTYCSVKARVRAPNGVAYDFGPRSWNPAHTGVGEGTYLHESRRFEDSFAANVDGWVTGSPGTQTWDSTEYHTASGSLKITTTQQWNSAWQIPANMTPVNPLAVGYGAEVYWGGWIKVTSGTWRLYCEAYDVNRNYLSGSYASTEFTSATWTQAAFGGGGHFSLPAGTCYVSIGLSPSSAGGGTAYLDEAYISVRDTISHQVGTGGWQDIRIDRFRAVDGASATGWIPGLQVVLSTAASGVTIDVDEAYVEILANPSTDIRKALGATGIPEAFVNSYAISSTQADVFTRTDAATLGGTWSEESPGFSIVTNQAVSDGSPLLARHINSTTGGGLVAPNLYASVRWYGGTGGVFTRAPTGVTGLADLTGYAFLRTAVDTFQISKYQSGTQSILGTYTATDTSAWYIQVYQKGSNVEGRFQSSVSGGTPIALQTDTSLPTNPSSAYYGGMIALSTGAVFDNYQAGTATSGYGDATVKVENNFDAVEATATASAFDAAVNISPPVEYATASAVSNDAAIPTLVDAAPAMAWASAGSSDSGDDFNRADSDFLGWGWGDWNGSGLRISSNRAVMPTFPSRAGFARPALTSDNWAQVDYYQTSIWARVGTRASTPNDPHLGDAYLLSRSSSGTAQVAKQVSGVQTQLGSDYTYTEASPTTLYISASGTSITTKVAGTTAHQVTDSSVSVGLFSYIAGGDATNYPPGQQFDNFRAGDLGPGATTSIGASAQTASAYSTLSGPITETDDFNRASLGGNWTNVDGGWSIISNSAAASTAAVAYWITQLPYTTTEVQAYFTGAKSHVFARGNTNGYATQTAYVWGDIGGLVFSLRKVVSGTATQLGNTVQPSGGPWTIVLRCDSSLIKGTVGAYTPVLVTDTSITSANTRYGMRSDAGSSAGLDNFQLTRWTTDSSADAGVLGGSRPPSEAATATASALDATADTVDGSADTNAPAECATATAASEDSAAWVQASDTGATATASAQDATGSVQAAAVEATATASALDVGRAATVEAATATAAGQDAGPKVGAAPQEGTSAATAYGITAGVATGSETAAASALGLDATATVAEVKAVDAIEATATALANDVTESGTVQAVEATATALGLDATANYSSSPTAEVASSTAAASDITSKVSPQVEASAATASAQDASPWVAAPAVQATATGTAQDPNPAVYVSAIEATADALGLDATVASDSAVTAQAVTADASALGNDISASVSPEAQEAVASALAGDVTGTGTAPAVEATATALALDATVSTASVTEAQAITADASALALDAQPTTSTSGDAQTATAAVLGLDAVASITTEAQAAAASGLANDVTESGTAQAIEATATAAALDASANWSSDVFATEATAQATAEDPNPSVTVDAGASGSALAQDSSPYVTVLAEAAEAAALALDATASTEGVGEAYAQTADATALAQDASADITTGAETALASVEAWDVSGPDLGLDDPTVSITAASIEAAAQADALGVSGTETTQSLDATATADSQDVTAAIEVLAEAAEGTALALDATTSFAVEAPAEAALVAALALDSSADIQASAQQADTSVLAQDPRAAVAALAEAALATASGLDASATLAAEAQAEAATATLSALDITAGVQTGSTEAQASASGQDPSGAGGFPASTAPATASGEDSYAGVAVDAQASADAAALDATVAPQVYAEVATATAEGNDAAIAQEGETLAHAECAEATAQTEGPTSSVAAGSEHSQASAAALDATVAQITEAQAGIAAASALALDASGQGAGAWDAQAEEASGSALGLDLTASISVDAQAFASASALDATVSTSSNVLAQVAEATATAYDPGPSIGASSTISDAYATSYDVVGDVSVQAFAETATANGSAYNVTLFLPAGGQNLYITILSGPNRVAVDSRVDLADVRSSPNLVEVLPSPNTAVVQDTANKTILA
jgi:hypothetical protein